MEGDLDLYGVFFLDGHENHSGIEFSHEHEELIETYPAVLVKIEGAHGCLHLLISKLLLILEFIGKVIVNRIHLGSLEVPRAIFIVFLEELQHGLSDLFITVRHLPSQTDDLIIDPQHNLKWMGLDEQSNNGMWYLHCYFAFINNLIELIMLGNKYETSAVRKIFDNIEYMLQNASTSEKEIIKDYLGDEVRVVNRYRSNILPKLKKLIEESKILQKTIPDQNQGGPIASLRQKLDLYECAVKQMSPSYPLDAKQRMLDYYNSNRQSITDQSMKLCLDYAISATNIVKDYQQSKQEVSFIWHQFKNFINLSDKYSLAFNIQLIRGYLMRTQAEYASKLAPFDQITSVSLILNQCIQKLKEGTPLGNYCQIINNIKIQALSQPLGCLAELISQTNKQKQVKVEEGEQFHPCMDENQYYQALQYIQILPAIAQSIQRIIQPGSKFDYKSLNPAYFTKIIDKIFYKINKTSQFQAKYNESQQHLSSFTQEIAMNNQELVYRQKLISQLRTEVDNLYIDVQKRQRQLELWRQFTVSLNEKIAEDATLIERLKKDIALLEKEANETKEAAMDEQNHQDLILLQELKQRFLLLSRQKNELHTQVYSLTHQLQDERIAHQAHIKQQIHKIMKIMHGQKMKEIQKIEERRRIEKSKLSKEAQELFDQLQQLKDKYYAEIGNKLMRSRMDHSICKSDKGVGDSFMIENNVLQGLDDEGNEDSPNRSVSELENQFKKQFQEEIFRLNTKNTELQTQAKSRQAQINDLNHELAKQMHQKQRVRNQLQSKTQNLLKMNEQKSISNNKIKQLIAANKMYQTALKKSSGTKQQSSTSCRPRFISYQKALLQGQIFDQNQHEKSILLKHITAYANLELIKTKLLYQYYPNNKTNFHSFIDNKKGLLCVVKASNTIIAGFYPGSLADGMTMNEGGLLISVRNDRSYALMEKKNDNSKINYRGMTYDPYYIVFGNAEMRIRTGQNRVFSNFGIQNGYFNYEYSSRNVNELLGEGDNREVEFQLCQFYQLFFEGQAIKSSNHTNLE